jgi:hypothetical protein
MKKLLMLLTILFSFSMFAKTCAEKMEESMAQCEKKLEQCVIKCNADDNVEKWTEKDFNCLLVCLQSNFKCQSKVWEVYSKCVDKK